MEKELLFSSFKKKKIKVDFQCCMDLTEYDLFRANKNSLHNYVWKGPVFINMDKL